MLAIDPKTHERLLEIIDRGVRLPPLPIIGVELQRIVSLPFDKINVDQLADLAEKDQSLAARLLKIANSPYYTTTKNITRVKQAIVTLGLDETLGTLSYFMLRRIMPAVPTLPHFDPNEFWRHSLGCANIARMLGHPQYLMNSLPGELYLAGLLHDIGKIVLAIYLPDEFSRCLEFANQNNVPLEEIEYASIGVDHAVLGAQLLEAWNLPNKILDGVGFHHRPEEAAEENRQFAATIELANMMASYLEVGCGGNPRHKPLEKAILRQDPRCPLSSPEAWERFMRGVAVSIPKQMAALDNETAPAAPAEAAPRREMRATPSRPAMPRPGIWRRIVSFFQQ
ncbi:HDOD domain-containing protein [bacterium]|nr:HDOD domain-containing protein [bacterium]